MIYCLLSEERGVCRPSPPGPWVEFDRGRLMAWVLDQIWKRLNAELFRAVGPERYALWIRHACPASFDEEIFTVHFASTHAKEKVESILRDPATQAAQRAANRNVRMRFAVEPTSFPGRPREALPAAPGEPTFASFVAGAGNRMALAAARNFARGGPADPRSLLLHSRSGLGRSHLLRAVRAELARRLTQGVLFFTGEQFRRYSLEAHLRDRREAFLAKCRSAQVFLFDDLQTLSGCDESQAALLDILSALERRGARAAVTSDRPPRVLDGFLRAVRARLRFDVEAAIDRPDAATGLAVLRAVAPADTPPAVLEAIAAHVRSSHADQIHCLARVLERPPASAATARAVVAEFLNSWSDGLRYEDIVRAAAESYGVRVGEIYSTSRSREAAEARQACFYLARKFLGHPYARIGDHFGGRDHSTILEACRKMEHVQGSIRDRLKRLEDRLQP